MLACPYEIFNLVWIIRPDIFENEKIFVGLYWDPKNKPLFNGKMAIDKRGSSNLPELNYWLNKHIMIRRLKKDVWNFDKYLVSWIWRLLQVTHLLKFV